MALSVLRFTTRTTWLKASKRLVTLQAVKQHPLILMQRNASEHNKKERPPTEFVLDGDLTIKKLAKKIGTSAGSIIKVLKDVGEDVDKGIHTTLDLDIAEFIALEFGVQPILPDVVTLESIVNSYRSKPTEESNVTPRPPVVTIMGHVDHGKTTLLDKLRRTAVAENEAGGITQHIGAFSVKLECGKKITFIDTPGHAAFNAMRGRGARVTDIVILVVSAEEGVKEQTLECIKHAKDAQVPVIVAINKIDRSKANPKRVKQELLQHGLQLEEFGGEYPAVEISALKGTNLNLLEEAIIAQAEIAELTANCTGFAEGFVLEAQTHTQKGLLASVLVQRGKLCRGDSIVAGNAFAKVRQIFDDTGKIASYGSPSTPVQILGWRSLPVLGDRFIAVESEEIAKKIIRMKEVKEKRERDGLSKLYENNDDSRSSSSHEKAGSNLKRKKLPMRVKLRQEAATQQKEEANDYKLSLIIKADYSGSLEAILDIINAFKSDHLELEVVSSGVGQISVSDLNIAEAVKGVVYGFNVTCGKEIDELPKKVEIPVRTFSVIYKLMDDIKAELCLKLPELPVETIVGEATILQVFQLTGQRKAMVAGCRVKKGTLTVAKDMVWRVFRNEELIHQGPLKTLKHGKQDINIAKKETECGVVFEKFSNFEANDQIQCVQITYEKQNIEWNNL